MKILRIDAIAHCPTHALPGKIYNIFSTMLQHIQLFQNIQKWKNQKSSST
jgi:hypothetical protein